MEKSKAKEEGDRKEHLAEASWPDRLLYAFIGVVVSLILGFWIWLYYGVEIEKWMNETQFDSAEWKSQDDFFVDYRMWPPRLCMIDDLVELELLDGLTESEVLKLLGPPNEEDLPFAAPESGLSYYLGPARDFFGIDSEWLLIYLRADRTVERYRIYQD